MKTNKFLLCALFCTLVMGLTGCNGNNPEQNGSTGTNGGGQTENPGGVTKLDKSSGCLNGSFSVANGEYVRFSMGNLQYQASTDTWRFAENQYDFIGTDNVTGGSVSHDATYGDEKSGTALADKIDLFGWSGSTATAKWGISTSIDYIDYGGDFVDWGQNVILNGGNKANQWRTLTYDEWSYLIYYRSNAVLLKGVARINLNAAGSKYANGLILLPDNWTAPAGVSFKSGFASEWEWSIQAYADYQTLTLDQWRKLEELGAVFLPASGRRYLTDYVGYDGCYWSATPRHDSYDSYARLLNFDSDKAEMGLTYRNEGLAVRLVRDVK